MGASAASVVGRTIDNLIGQFVGAPDVPLAGAAAQAHIAGTRAPVSSGFASRMRPAGRARSASTGSRRSRRTRASSTSSTPKGRPPRRPRPRGSRAPQGSSAAAATSTGPRTAADLLHARGLIVDHAAAARRRPAARVRSMRSPGRRRRARLGGRPAVRATRPRREILWELNRDFHQRRASFFQDVEPLIAALPGSPRRPHAARCCRATYGAGAALRQRRRLRRPGPDRRRAHTGARRLARDVRRARGARHRERAPAHRAGAARAARRARRGGRGDGARGPQPHRGDPQRGGAPAEAGRTTARCRPICFASSARRRCGSIGSSGTCSIWAPADAARAGGRAVRAGARSVAVLGRPRRATTPRSWSRPARAPWPEIDPDLTQLALWNVVRNAVQASPRESGSRSASRCGASARRCSSMTRARASRPSTWSACSSHFHTTRATGTGIGLAVVRRVVEACHGSIEIGASPAGGGRFVMVFPSG